MKNRHWVLDHYPDGQDAKSPWRVVTNEDTEPGPRQMLVRTQWLSLGLPGTARTSRVPETLVRMMAGQNRGKQCVPL